MTWDRLLEIDPGEGTPLRERIEALFAQQRATWPALGDGEAALARLAKRRLTDGGDEVVVQFNPARRRSTHARVDVKSLEARPCFLCPENMPPEERGVAFEDLVVMPNPFPVLPMHCTIAAREHRPQEIAGRVGAFLRLAAQVGPDLGALYNGPRCGASAPDHFHFQAARALEIPILSQLPAEAPSDSPRLYTSFGRQMIMFRGPSAVAIEQDLQRAIDLLGEPDAPEPMINLVARSDGATFTVVLFPRGAHRPRCYFLPEPDRIAVSPAVLEMGGVLVTTEPADFERIDAPTARAIYEEVSLAGESLELVMSRLTK